MSSAVSLLFNLVSVRDVCQISPLDCDEIMSWTQGMAYCKYNKVNVILFEMLVWHLEKNDTFIFS